jgi:hypothetical protein
VSIYTGNMATNANVTRGASSKLNWVEQGNVSLWLPLFHDLLIYLLTYLLTHWLGRAIAQAVSAWLPTAARVRAQVCSCGICGRQSGNGAGFLRVPQFPLPIFIPPVAPQSPSMIWGWYNRPKSGRSTKWTQSHPTNNKTKLN